MGISHTAVIRSSLLKVTIESQVMIMNFQVECAQIIGQAFLRKDEAEHYTCNLVLNS